jgi:hypothetical protein
MEEFKRIVASQKPDSHVRHYHIVELKSSKVVVTIVALSFLLLVSFIGNFHQLEVDSRMTDNDLKYGTSDQLMVLIRKTYKNLKMFLIIPRIKN